MPDMSLAGFMTHLAGVTMELKRGNHAAMERACQVVKAEAVREIGTYQDAAGPFSGWAELADATKDQRVALGFSENDPGLRTGEMRDSIQHHAEAAEGVIGSDDDKLVWFELGTSKQPPRSVLGIAAAHKAEQVAKILGHGVVAHLLGGGVHNGAMQISDP